MKKEKYTALEHEIHSEVEGYAEKQYDNSY